MLEFHITNKNDEVRITCGELNYKFAYTEVAFLLRDISEIKSELVDYGKKLYRIFFEEVFHDSIQDEILDVAHGRIALLIDDNNLARLPFEFTRLPNNQLLAGAVRFVRITDHNHRQDTPVIHQSLDVVTIPVNPIDEDRHLQTEHEYQNICTSLGATNRRFHLKRVRPPTISKLSETLNPTSTSIIHFMGHSHSNEGIGVLSFEDEKGFTRYITAPEFSASLNQNVLFVFLNSCLSAQQGKLTELGNIALELVKSKVPYALGLQFDLPDTMAILLSDLILRYIIQGKDLEGAVTFVRYTLDTNPVLKDREWLAGACVLYTNQTQQLNPLILEHGKTIISPDPDTLKQKINLSSIDTFRAERLLGRHTDINEIIRLLETQSTVTIHGISGIGKTALVAEFARRISWDYDDRVLAFSFSAYSGQPTDIEFDSQLVDLFFRSIAQMCEINTTSTKYQGLTGTDNVELLQDISNWLKANRSILILDGIEFIISSYMAGNPHIAQLIDFIKSVSNENLLLLMTSRIQPPKDWSFTQTMKLGGLDEASAANLVLQSVSEKKRHLIAYLPERIRLAKALEGHPLALQLFSAQFCDQEIITETSFHDFVTQIEDRITTTKIFDENKILASYLDDAILSLTDVQKRILRSATLFVNSFTLPMLEFLFDPKVDNIVHELETLIQLNLITSICDQLGNLEISRYQIHPIVKIYISDSFTLGLGLKLRYLANFSFLSVKAHDPQTGYNNSIYLQYIYRHCLLDFENALQLDIPMDITDVSEEELVGLNEETRSNFRNNVLIFRSRLAHNLGMRYQNWGNYTRARALKEFALELSQELADTELENVILQDIASEALHTGEDISQLIIVQENILATFRKSDHKEGITATLQEIALLLSHQGQHSKALAYLDEALIILKDLDAPRIKGIVQRGLAVVHANLNNRELSTKYLDDALATFKQLNIPNEIAGTLVIVASHAAEEGKYVEAQEILIQALELFTILKDPRGISTVHIQIATIYQQQQNFEMALTSAWTAFKEISATGMTIITNAVKVRLQDFKSELGAEEFNLLWALTVDDKQPDWLQNTFHLVDSDISNLIRNTVAVLTFATDEKNKWIESLQDVMQKLTEEDAPDAEYFISKIIELLNGKTDIYNPNNSYYDAWNSIISDLENYGKAQTEATHLTPEQRDYIINSTIDVMLLIEDKKPQWRAEIEAAIRGSLTAGAIQVTEYSRCLLNIIDGKDASLPIEHPYSDDLEAIKSGLRMVPSARSSHNFIALLDKILKTEDRNEAINLIKANSRGLSSISNLEDFLSKISAVVQSSSNDEKKSKLTENITLIRNFILNQNTDEDDDISRIEEVDKNAGKQPIPNKINTKNESNPLDQQTAVVKAFVNSSSWYEAKRILEENSAQLLNNSEAEEILLFNIHRALNSGDRHSASLFEAHLSVLKNARLYGIEKAFEAVQKTYDTKIWGEDLMELFALAARAINGSSDDRLFIIQKVLEKKDSTYAPEGRTLLSAVAEALVGGDLDTLGKSIGGMAKEPFVEFMWREFVKLVNSAGLDPEEFNKIVINTVNVLTSVPQGLSMWRSELNNIRNYATENGFKHFLVLLSNIESLLERNGNPESLGEGLTGIYKDTWEKILTLLENHK